MSADSGPGNREVARRLFAAEFDDATLSYSESDEERAPNYVVTPTGARVNRLFAVGVLTEVEEVNEDSLRGRVVDPTGAFVTYAGQYQPDEHAFLSRADPPMFVALAGKARTFEPADSDRVFTSVRPESLNEVDAEARDRWVVTAAERTLARIAVFAEVLDADARGDALREALEREGVDASLAAGIPKAIERYGTGTAYLEAVRSLAVEALEQVAGERDAVRSLDTMPGDSTPTELGPLPEPDVSLGDVEPVSEEPVADDAEAEAGGEADETAAETEAEPVETEAAEAVSESAESESEPEATEPDEKAEDTGPDEEPESTEPVAETEAAPAVEPEAAESEAEPAEATEAEPSEAAVDGSTETTESEPRDPETSESEPQESVAEPEEPAAGDELGDFDPSETVDDDSEALTESERKEVEEEFGTEFATGSEVGEPGEAGIDVPTSEEDLEELEDETPGTEPETEETESEGAADGEAPALDLETVVVDTMSELDDGDGVDREAVVAAVVDEHGVDADAVDDAIQDAMMSGKCYEPGEGTLKAI